MKQRGVGRNRPMIEDEKGRNEITKEGQNNKTNE